jgi:hypothetical protein
LAFHCSSSIEVPLHLLRYGEQLHRERYIVLIVVLVVLVLVDDAAAAY